MSFSSICSAFKTAPLRVLSMQGIQVIFKHLNLDEASN